MVGGQGPTWHDLRAKYVAPRAGLEPAAILGLRPAVPLSRLSCPLVALAELLTHAGRRLFIPYVDVLYSLDGIRDPSTGGYPIRNADWWCGDMETPPFVLVGRQGQGAHAHGRRPCEGRNWAKPRPFGRGS